MSFVSLADRVVCINLKERNDRYNTAVDRFASVGLGSDVVNFLRVERHPRGGRYGCYDSHRAVIQQAFDDGMNSVLIFEDDVEFRDGWARAVEEAKEFLESGIKFDALMMGPELKFVDEKTFPRIWRVKSIHAHCYIVSRQGMQKFISSSAVFEREIDQYPQDVIQNSVWQNIYAHVSMSIGQDNNLGTDNHWLPDIPLPYAPWVQNVVIPSYSAGLQPLIRSTWWRCSWFGNQYMLALDHCIIDDGMIKLKGLWWLDLVVIFFLMLSHRPPYGYLDLLLTFFRICGPFIGRRLKLKKLVPSAPTSGEPMSALNFVSDAVFRRSMLLPSFGHLAASVTGLVLVEIVSIQWVVHPAVPTLQALEASMGRLSMSLFLGLVIGIAGFWGIGTLFALPALFKVEEWKIQVNKKVDSAALVRAMPLILFNFLLGSVFGPIVLCTLLPESSFDWNAVPSTSTLVRDAVVWLLVDEVMTFYVHRWLHENKRAYAAIHKLHHTWTAPVSYVAIYCNPIELLIQGISPLLAGPILCGSHVSAIGIFFFLGLVHTTAVHSGYWFCDDNGMHDEHHHRFNVNFGQIGFMDSWYGTYRLPSGATQRQLA